MMKALIIGMAVVTGPIYAFAASASLQASQPIPFTIKNKLPGLVIEQVTLVPRLTCSTTNPDVGGEASTYTNEAVLNTVESVNLQDPKLMKFSVQIVEGGSVSSPEKMSFFSKSACHAGVSFYFKVKGQKYYPMGNDDGSDYFWNDLGSVDSKGDGKDLTAKLASELAGSYELSVADGGTVYDADKGGHVPYCKLVLKKGSKEIGRAMQFEGKGEICKTAM